MRPRVVFEHGAPEGGPVGRRCDGVRAIEREVVRAHVTDLLFAGASMLEPSEMLTAVCETAAPHLALANVVLFKRLAGQSRTLVWSAPDVPASSRMFARERAWSSAAQLVEGSAPDPTQLDGDKVASASLEDERLGLAAMLYVESRRALDRSDRALLEDLLRQMLGLPEGEPRLKAAVDPPRV